MNKPDHNPDPVHREAGSHRYHSPPRRRLNIHDQLRELLHSEFWKEATEYQKSDAIWQLHREVERSIAVDSETERDKIYSRQMNAEWVRAAGFLFQDYFRNLIIESQKTNLELLKVVLDKTPQELVDFCRSSEFRDWVQFKMDCGDPIENISYKEISYMMQ